jgi:hypothetical protein
MRHMQGGYVHVGSLAHAKEGRYWSTDHFLLPDKRIRFCRMDPRQLDITPALNAQVLLPGAIERRGHGKQFCGPPAGHHGPQGHWVHHAGSGQ